MANSTKKTRRKPRQTKDRVLQARIPQNLDDELRGQAEQLGLSVSTVVRNVLLNTFELVEGVVTDSSNLARALQGRKQVAQPDQENAAADGGNEPDVIGWQEAILNRNGICDQCNTILHKGKRAAVGVPAGPRPLLLCLECLAALSAPDADQQTGAPS